MHTMTPYIQCMYGAIVSHVSTDIWWKPSCKFILNYVYLQERVISTPEKSRLLKEVGWLTN